LIRSHWSSRSCSRPSMPSSCFGTEGSIADYRRNRFNEHPHILSSIVNRP
jgi:hypothetical protein